MLLLTKDSGYYTTGVNKSFSGVSKLKKRGYHHAELYLKQYLMYINYITGY